MLVIIGIVVFLIAVVIVLLLWMRLDNRFYNYLDIYPELEILKRNKNVIFEEIAKTEVKKMVRRYASINRGWWSWL